MPRGKAAIAHHVKNDPAPILVVLPTEAELSGEEEAPHGGRGFWFL
jgi:hypothetical protein